MGKDPGQSLSAGLVRMQAINTYVVQLPQHLHKDGRNHFPTEERSSAFDRQGTVGHIWMIALHFLPGCSCSENTVTQGWKSVVLTLVMRADATGHSKAHVADGRC